MDREDSCCSSCHAKLYGQFRYPVALDRLQSIISLLQWMVRQFVEADLQEDVMKLDTVPANLYSSKTLKLARVIKYPFEELLAWAYAVDLMKPMGLRNGRTSCMNTFCSRMGTKYLGLWDPH